MFIAFTVFATSLLQMSFITDFDSWQAPIYYTLFIVANMYINIQQVALLQKNLRRNKGIIMGFKFIVLHLALLTSSLILIFIAEIGIRVFY